LREHIRRAMQLNGENSTNVSMLAAPYVALGDPGSAVMVGRRAVDLDPASPYCLMLYGFAQIAAGRTSDAIVTLHQQDRLASHDHTRYAGLMYLGMADLFDGMLDEARQALDQSLALHPDFHPTLKLKAITEALLGNEELALATVRRLREVEPTKTIDHHVRQMMAYSGLGDRLDEPVATLRRLWDATEPSA